jgi:hypothetical protein
MNRLISPIFLCAACGSDPAIHGSDGSSGANGQDCWDLNGNGAADEAEDLNGDGSIDVGDCQGAPGVDGQDCWDLNGNGEPEPEEDLNGDGSVDAADCQAVEDGDTGELGSEMTAYFGDISFTSTSAMEAFCTQHDTVWGNVYILSEDFGLTNIDGLECLTYIDGTLYIHGSVIETANLPLLTGVGDFDITTGHSLVSVSMPLLEEIHGYLYLYYSPTLTTVELPSLSRIDEYLMIQTTALSSLDGFSSLQTIGGHLYLDNNDSLTDVSGLMGITSIGDYVTINDNDHLSDADIDALIEAIGESNIGGEISTWGNGG